MLLNKASGTYEIHEERTMFSASFIHRKLLQQQLEAVGIPWTLSGCLECVERSSVATVARAVSVKVTSPGLSCAM